MNRVHAGSSGIHGKVIDAGGSVIGGARVFFKNKATGRVFRTRAGAGGTFEFGSAPIGEYEVVVEAEGFRSFVSQRKHINAAIAQGMAITLRRWSAPPDMTQAQYDRLQAMDGERLIVPTTDADEVEALRLQGCIVIHELNEAVAVKCPRGVSVEGAIPDEVLHELFDAEANTQIGADQVQSLGIDGSGVTVAVVDNGVNVNHPEFVDLSDPRGRSKIVEVKAFGFPSTEDENGHGTAVAGIITANGVRDSRVKGVAPGAKVWVAKVCGAGTTCSGSDALAAIEYIVNNNKARVISISLGGPGNSGAHCDSGILAEKVNWAVSRGVTVAAASGVSSLDSGVATPACASGAIAVGAVDKVDVKLSFSGSGPALDLVAPGVEICTTGTSPISGPSTGCGFTGTSGSTPHVTGVIALLLQAFPCLTDAQIKDALYKTAKELGPSGRDDDFGNGRVDAKAAYDYLTNLPVEPLAIHTEDVLPKAKLNKPYSAQVQVCGGRYPYTWSITSGNLPSGLTLNPSTGEISGSPSDVCGKYRPDITVSDSTGTRATLKFTMKLKGCA